jgi:hypothetical protein
MSALHRIREYVSTRTEPPADDPARPIAEPSEVWRCWCGVARANPYGRPTFDGRLRLEGCGSCGDLVITGANYDVEKALKAVINKHLI